MLAKVLLNNSLNNYDRIESQGKRVLPESSREATTLPLLQEDLDAVVLKPKGNKCPGLLGFQALIMLVACKAEHHAIILNAKLSI